MSVSLRKNFEKKEIPDGMEICEVQLMSLANKIHNTEVNHEIDKYLESINALFENTDKDELIKKFFSVEFTRFFNYYQKSKDLNVASSSRDSEGESGRDYGGSKNETRYFINVGRKDGYDWMKLKDFLKEVLELGRDDVFKVDVKGSFSFFNTEKEIQEKVLAFFTDFKHDGRFVNVEVSEDRGGGRNRGGRSGRRKDGGGGRRRRDDKPRGERRSSGRRSDSGSGNRSDRRSSEHSGRRSDRRSSESSGNRSERRRSGGESKPSRRSETASASDRPRRSRRK